MKNYVKAGQKLPLYGVGPYIVYVMAGITLVGIVLFCYIFKIGVLSAPCDLLFRAVGIVLIVAGVVIWFIGALKSGMDESITENRLKTDGIYAWVRNPMYSGWWMLITGIGLMWHDVFLLIIPVVNWGIMTIILKNTEEKWLTELYGEEYISYTKRVNRCVPWIPRK